MSTTDEKGEGDSVLRERVEQILEENKVLRDRVSDLEERMHNQDESTRVLPEDEGPSAWIPPSVSRRGAMAGAAGLAALLLGTGNALGQETVDPDLLGTACEWLGDQQAASYRLWNLGLLHNVNHSDATAQESSPGSLTAGQSGGEVRPYWDFGDGLVELATSSTTGGFWEEQDSTTITPVSPYTGISIEDLDISGVSKGSTTSIISALEDTDTAGGEVITQPTDDVSTGATVILDTNRDTNAGFIVLVNGDEQGDNSRFFDVITFFRSNTDSTTRWNVNHNSPDPRTYGQSGGRLTLAMDAGTYDVSTTAILTRREPNATS